MCVEDDWMVPGRIGWDRKGWKGNDHRDSQKYDELNIMIDYDGCRGTARHTFGAAGCGSLVGYICIPVHPWLSQWCELEHERRRV